MVFGFALFQARQCSGELGIQQRSTTTGRERRTERRSSQGQAEGGRGGGVSNTSSGSGSRRLRDAHCGQMRRHAYSASQLWHVATDGRVSSTQLSTCAAMAVHLSSLRQCEGDMQGGWLLSRVELSGHEGGE